MATPLPSAERFDMLDAWRGLAAAAVVLHHTSSFQHGHEAVILFFVISGYCIAGSMEACLAKGMGLRAFAWRRVRRIYPPYFLAVAFFVLTRWLRAALGGSPPQWPLHVWAQNLTLTQWLSLLQHPKAFAADNPTLFVAAFWSLCYEEQFYLVMAVVMLLPAMRSRVGVLVALMAVGLAWVVLAPRLCFGPFLEYWPELGIGCLLFYRLCRWRSGAVRRLFDVVLVALMALGAWAHFALDERSGAQRPAFGELLLASAFALVLVATRPLNDLFLRSRLGRGLMALGVISYSLYLVHQFNVHAIRAVAGWLLPSGTPAAISSAVQLALHVGLGALFWHVCERPFTNRSLAPTSRPPGPRDEVVA